jgi:hypothetical protein
VVRVSDLEQEVKERMLTFEVWWKSRQARQRWLAQQSGWLLKLILIAITTVDEKMRRGHMWLSGNIFIDEVSWQGDECFPIDALLIKYCVADADRSVGRFATFNTLFTKCIIVHGLKAASLARLSAFLMFASTVQCSVMHDFVQRMVAVAVCEMERMNCTIDDEVMDDDDDDDDEREVVSH